MGITSVRSSTRSKCSHAVGCRNETWRSITVSSLESFRCESISSLTSGFLGTDVGGVYRFADELKCRRSLWRDCRSKRTILAQLIESSRCCSKFRIQDLEYVEGNGLAQPHLQGELTSSSSACRHP